MPHLCVGGLQHPAGAAKQAQEHELRLLQARVGGNRLQQEGLDFLQGEEGRRRGVGSEGAGQRREGGSGKWQLLFAGTRRQGTKENAAQKQASAQKRDEGAAEYSPVRCPKALLVLQGLRRARRASVASAGGAGAARGGESAAVGTSQAKQLGGRAHVCIIGPLAQHKLQQEAVVLVDSVAAVGKGGHLQEVWVLGLG